MFRPLIANRTRPWSGSAFGGASGRIGVPKIVDLSICGKTRIGSMINHTLSLERINKAFDLMYTGESIRSVGLLKALSRGAVRMTIQTKARRK